METRAPSLKMHETSWAAENGGRRWSHWQGKCFCVSEVSECVAQGRSYRLEEITHWSCRWLWGPKSKLRACLCVSGPVTVCVPGTQSSLWQVGGASTCWMNQVSIGEYHGLRVGSALLSIVAGCIIIGVSRECDADAVGGIFLGAGGLGECLWNLVYR